VSQPLPSPTPPTDLDRVRELINELGTTYNATKVFNQRMESTGLDYRMPVSTMDEMFKRGKGKPAMVGFVRFVLEELV
jgi:hypothetical protein